MHRYSALLIGVKSTEWRLESNILTVVKYSHSYIFQIFSAYSSTALSAENTPAFAERTWTVERRLDFDTYHLAYKAICGIAARLIDDKQ